MKESQRGALHAVAAYGTWGLFPFYFKLLRRVASAVVFAHRIVWSFLLLVLFLAITKRLPAAWRAVGNGRTRGALLLSAGWIAINWLSCLYLVSAGHVLQASLEYFLTPL